VQAAKPTWTSSTFLLCSGGLIVLAAAVQALDVLSRDLFPPSGYYGAGRRGGHDRAPSLTCAALGFLLVGLGLVLTRQRATAAA
jgi:hypothetical protein